MHLQGALTGACCGSRNAAQSRRACSARHSAWPSRHLWIDSALYDPVIFELAELWMSIFCEAFGIARANAENPITGCPNR